MKKLLIIVFTFMSFNVFSICERSTVEEVNSCTINDVLHVLVKMIYPDYVEVSLKVYVKNSEQRYTFNPELGLTPFEQLVIDPMISLSQLETKLAEWKAPIIARLEFIIRAKAIKHLRAAMIKCSLHQANSAIFRRNMIRDLNYAKLECLESKIPEINAEIEAEETKENSRKNAANAIKNFNCASLSGFVNLLCMERRK